MRAPRFVICGRCMQKPCMLHATISERASTLLRSQNVLHAPHIRTFKLDHRLQTEEREESQEQYEDACLVDAYRKCSITNQETTLAVTRQQLVAAHGAAGHHLIRVRGLRQRPWCPCRGWGAAPPN